MNNNNNNDDGRSLPSSSSPTKMMMKMKMKTSHNRSNNNNNNKKKKNRQYEIVSQSHDNDHNDHDDGDGDNDIQAKRGSAAGAAMGTAAATTTTYHKEEEAAAAVAAVVEQFQDEYPFEITDGNSSSHHDYYDDDDDSPQLLQQQQQQQLNSNNDENVEQQQQPSSSSSSSNTQISWMDACMHLMKGNLGPGCLNIPHAFVLSGWLLGSLLFVVVALQGIYSMFILTYCKDLLMVQHHRQQQQQLGNHDANQQTNNHHHHDNDNNPNHRNHQHQEQQSRNNEQQQLPSLPPPPPPLPTTDGDAVTAATAVAEATTTTEVLQTVPPPPPPPQQQHHHHRMQMQQQAEISTKDLLDDDEKYTFMTVAKYAVGSKIHVQIFLFALQVGVCCVFLSLLSTNLQAQLPRVGPVASIVIVTLSLLGIVLQRHLKGLRWLSTIANVFMITAITTACIFGITEYKQQTPEERHNEIKVVTSDWGDIATFVSAMFFSFEGIGLVLPVENSFTTGYTSIQETSKANSQYRRFVLPGAMSMVAILFISIGISASIGYPDIENGSITAYLKEKYPNNLWLDIVNVLVMVAVFFTFPLQLTPAMEVLDEWLYGENNETKNCLTRIVDASGRYHFQFDEETTNRRHRGSVSDSLGIDRVDSTDMYRADALLEEVQPEVHEDDDDDGDDDGYESNGRCCCNNSCISNFVPPYWVIQRWVVVFGCAIVVLVVNDLGLLMSLFGSVGQTGLALMPCVIHWNLQRQGIAPQHRILQCMDIFTIGLLSLS